VAWLLHCLVVGLSAVFPRAGVPCRAVKLAVTDSEHELCEIGNQLASLSLWRLTTTSSADLFFKTLFHAFCRSSCSVNEIVSIPLYSTVGIETGCGKYGCGSILGKGRYIFLFFSTRLEFFTAVTMKKAVFWNDIPRGSCKNRRIGGTYPLHRGVKNQRVS
jgi:hypothetical protein